MTEAANPKSMEELERTKLETEIIKLQADLADLRKPFVLKASFWIAMVPMAIALGSLFFQYLSNQDNIDLARNQLSLETEKSKFEVTKSAAELETARNELKMSQAIVAEQKEGIRKLVEKQFDLFGKVCEAAGKVASAATWSESDAALKQLDDPEVNLIKNQKITDAIEALRSAFKEINGKTDKHPEDLQEEVLAISGAVRDAWEEERNGTAAGVNSAATAAMELSFKQRHYREAMDVATKLSQAKNWVDVQNERRQFWQLYLGQLVLVESRGTDGVSPAMYGFGQTLLEWKEGSPSDEVRKKMEEKAKALTDACDNDLSPPDKKS